jgi:hypothetical protein
MDAARDRLDAVNNLGGSAAAAALRAIDPVKDLGGEAKDKIKDPSDRTPCSDPRPAPRQRHRRRSRDARRSRPFPSGRARAIRLDGVG